VWGSRLCGKVESMNYCICWPPLLLCLAQFDQGVILHERYEDSRRTSRYIQSMARANRRIFPKNYYITVYIADTGRTKIPSFRYPADPLIALVMFFLRRRGETHKKLHTLSRLCNASSIIANLYRRTSNNYFS